MTKEGENDEDDEDEATTPKASARAAVDKTPVPTLTLADDGLPVPLFPVANSAQRAAGTSLPSLASSSSSRIMPPPARPSSTAPTTRPPTLTPNPSRHNQHRHNHRGGLVSLSGPTSDRDSGLSVPLLTSTRPTHPSGRHKVQLAPGHSPLDWARLTSDPTANLRGLPAEAPALLRVTPSQLKTMNGRKGRDAWTALGGFVYNITPYVPFHPGGEGQLLRCAGRDGNRLFQEVHGWVNYDNMLSACRVGILVEENASTANPMEEMD